jgi:tetratricopeptide (TPR) repeat protein
MESIDSKLATAQALKAEGNELFKQQKYRKAIVKYATVISYVKGLPGSKRGLSGMAELASSQDGAGLKVTAEQEVAACELEATALLNMATCHLKLMNASQAVEFAVKALTIKPDNNWKAHLRRGEGLLMKGDCDGAKIALQEAQRLAPDAPAQSLVQAELKKVNVRLKEQIIKQKQAFAGIFGGAISRGSSSSASSSSYAVADPPAAAPADDDS